jgi:HK97 family phage major capsid protein
MPQINRDAVEALIQEQITPAIFQDTPKASQFMALAKKLPNMTSKQTRIRVLDFLPLAYWVNGDTGRKTTSKQEWDKVYLTAEELAVIVPIPEAVLDDVNYDIMGEVTPRVVEAIGQRVDSACIFGVGRPSSWQADIITLARQAGNNVTNAADLYGVLMAENGVFNKVEEYGYTVSGAIAAPTFKAKLRGVRDDLGHPLFKNDMQGPTQYSLDGTPLYFSDNGSFDASIAQLVAGSFGKAVYAIRQDITTKILDQAVIQDPDTAEIVFNLAQQDMIALRVVFRMGWAMPNPATRLDVDRISCPFAYLEPASPVTTQAVTFTVSDSVAAAVADAYVNVNGARKKTNASGVAVFNLRAGTYSYTAKKSDYTTVSGSVTVASSGVAVAVTLPASS